MSKKHLILLISLVFLVTSCSKKSNKSSQPASEKAARTASVIEQLYDRKFSNIIVSSEGWVEKLLDDDTEGSKHQKFIIKLVNKQTLLVNHNIDIAPRIQNLKVNDLVSFRGEYVHNNEGGLIHWTHQSKDSKHANGWIQHKGKRYE